jgi:hypothetical protein
MTVDQSMWTPLESALAPFKELARLNRQTVTDAAGQATQLVLKADRCRVNGARIELGFSVGADTYAVDLDAADYRRDSRWDFEGIRTDISAGLRSGALKPGAVSSSIRPSGGR